MKFCVIDGCACPIDVAPYAYLVLRGAGQSANSIYRGEDAAPLLHRHGKMTQAEIHRAFPTISNPAGFSEHELRSDGAGDSEPRGSKLPWWKQGIDSGTDSHHDKVAINESAARLGWETEHPYARGVEGHHWRFKTRPRPKGLKQRAQIIHLRATLPRR